MRVICSSNHESWCSTVDADSYWSNGLWTAKYEHCRLYIHNSVVLFYNYYPHFSVFRMLPP